MVTFQSRFGKAEWLKPYTEPTLVALAQQGVGRVDVFCPGFAADCLETLEEIDQEARAAFLAAGGKEFGYIPCLNDQHEGIAALAAIAMSHLAGWTTPRRPARRSSSGEAARPGGRRVGLGRGRLGRCARLAGHRSPCRHPIPRPACGSTSGCGRRASSRPARSPPKRSPGAASASTARPPRLARGPDRRHARACARARSRAPSSSLGVSRVRGPAPVGPGAVPGDGGKRRRARGRRAGAPPDARAGRGASSRAARPSATAASSPTGTAGAPRSTATEAIAHSGRENGPLKLQGNAPKSSG